jgi:hypothetical protein
MDPERTATERAGWTQSLWAIAPTKIPEPLLPESFARPQWNPQRSETARAAWTQALWAVPPTRIPDPVLPESYARPVWNPERSGFTRAGWTQSLWAIPPQQIPEPVLPQFVYSRQLWIPDRSQLIWNPLQFAAIVVPTWGYEMLAPQMFLRQAWNPERSGVSRAGWTQALWAVAPQKIPEPVLPASFTRPAWNPERSHTSANPLIIPRGPVPTTLPERFPPFWIPERTGVIIAQRIIVAPAPLLSWSPQLLERYVQSLRSAPNLDLFSPALIIAIPPVIGPRLFGRRDSGALTGRADATGLSGKRDAVTLSGERDGAARDGLRSEEEGPRGERVVRPASSTSTRRSARRSGAAASPRRTSPRSSTS